MDNQLTIEITRKDQKLSTVKVFMPVWKRIGDDGKLYIKLPALDLETCAKDEDDVEAAIEEAVQCFCRAAEDFGLGLESELEYAGWEKIEAGDHLLMNIKPNNLILNSIINTGEQQALELDLAC